MQQLEHAMTKTQFVSGRRVSKGDPGYGRPEEGTKTAERGKRAHSHVHKGGGNERKTGDRFWRFSFSIAPFHFVCNKKS